MGIMISHPRVPDECRQVMLGGGVESRVSVCWSKDRGKGQRTVSASVGFEEANAEEEKSREDF